jgi:hypothetical protein
VGDSVGDVWASAGVGGSSASLQKCNTQTLSHCHNNIKTCNVWAYIKDGNGVGKMIGGSVGNAPLRGKGVGSSSLRGKGVGISVLERSVGESVGNCDKM